VAVKIRLMRVGKKKQPTYRVVVADARSPRDGRTIETIGHYGPREEPSRIQIDADRALDWLRKGAKPSEPVQKLLTISGIWATFTADHPDVQTKLNRRGHVTGRVPAKVAAAPEPAVPAPAPAPVAASETVVEAGAGDVEATEPEAAPDAGDASE
jgi:small subunit ribosomal protein S16